MVNEHLPQLRLSTVLAAKSCHLSFEVLRTDIYFSSLTMKVLGGLFCLH
jgi:hypothetical protein